MGGFGGRRRSLSFRMFLMSIGRVGFEQTVNVAALPQRLGGLWIVLWLFSFLRFRE